MRNTDGSRALAPLTLPPRPAERVFSTRELLLTTWDQRAKMAPGDEVKFGYDRWMLELRLRNAGKSIYVAETLAFHAEKDGKPDPEKPAPSTPARRRKAAPALI